MTKLLTQSPDEDKNKPKELCYSYFEAEAESTALDTVYDLLFRQLIEVKKIDDT